MKVEELRKQLKGIRGEKEIFLSSDAEGNGCNKVDYVMEKDEVCVIYPEHGDAEAD